MSDESNSKNRLVDILLASTKLGFTSFGGPVAHLSYFKDEYVDRKKWIDDKTYADIIALCQFLPGPASSQVGIAIGMLRGGILGGVVSWLGFTLPSIVVLVLFGLFYQTFDLVNADWISSLKIVAVAVVAHAVLGMGKKLTPDKPRLAIALIAAMSLLLFSSALLQIVIIILAGITGFLFFTKQAQTNVRPFSVSISKVHGVISLSILVLLLIGLPIASSQISNVHVQLFDTFFRVGSLVFGGGHVVLPMLEREVVPIGFLTAGDFLAGYGMAQAVPGPLFTFASYLGTMIQGIFGAIIATVGIFLPSFLLIVGALPFLNELRQRSSFQGVLIGVNASVVGILIAAFYDPVFKSSISSPVDFGIAVVLFSLLHFWKVPAWLIVIIGVAAGMLLSLF